MDKQEYQQHTQDMLRGNIKLLRIFLPLTMRNERGNSYSRIYLRWTELQHLRHTHGLANMLKD